MWGCGAGDYVIHVALRHDAAKVLEDLKHLVLAVERKVDPGITVPCHTSLHNAITGGKPMSVATLRIGERCVCRSRSAAMCLLHPSRVRRWWWCGCRLVGRRRC